MPCAATTNESDVTEVISIENRIELCQLTDIPDNGSKEFEVNGHALFAVRQRDQVYIYRNNCPHTGLPLNWQPDQFMDYDKRFIQCAIHAAIFEPKTGLCVSGPCYGDILENIPCLIDRGRITIQSLAKHTE